MTTTFNSTALRLAAVAVAACMGGAGVALGVGAAWAPASALVDTVAAQPEAPPAEQPLWRRSETRLTFSDGAERVEVRIVDGEMEIRVNGEPISDERIQREGDVFRVLDDAGAPIVTLRRTLDGGWSIGHAPGGALRLLGPIDTRRAPKPGGPRLGVTLAPVDGQRASELGVEKPEAAALIREVAPGSSAEQAGLRAGDVILAIDGDENMSPTRVVDRVAAAEAGQEITVRVRRDAETLDIRVKLAGAARADDERRLFLEPFGRLPAPWGGDLFEWDENEDDPAFRLFPDDFVGRAPLAEMERILRQIERLRQRLREDFEPFGFIEKQPFPEIRPFGDEPPARFDFDFNDGFMADFNRRMEAFQQRMKALGARMGEIGKRIAQEAREDAGPAIARQAHDALTEALEAAPRLNEDELAVVRSAFSSAIDGVLDNAHWSYDSEAGVVELSQSPAELARRLRQRFESALSAADAELSPGAEQAAEQALQAAAEALAGARATLSEQARARIDALLEEMQQLHEGVDLPALPREGQPPAPNDSPVKRDANKATA